MTIRLRTIKITLATILSLLIADFFQLDYSVSAGIIAILSILETKRASLTTAGQRVVSTILALAISSILFQLFGFSTWVFGVYLALYVPIAYKLNVHVGIAPCSVLVTHLLLEQSTSAEWLLNEFLLMVIGAGMAVLFNLYMPSKEVRITELRQEVETAMIQILLSFDRQLRKEDQTADTGYLIDELDELLNEALKAAYSEYENQLVARSEYEIQYFEMRKVQSEILKQMAINLRLSELPTKQNATLAELFALTSQQLHESNSGVALLEEIDMLMNDFRDSALPKTRAEFENRAILFQLLNDFKRFIQVKRAFYEEYGQKRAKLPDE